ncbi:unnamed protein product [Adineta steineri]|uniref:Uncharacterized protein n=1 Tax=Adineta steineri TaxID=433720 RepID=A0A814D2P8_9BILA|nr:unnamed protein product [Adineta steineri]CAF0948946.1 unnamed protein product [Adineta steineri]CAF1094862.1 unnamed protein product [Adineta steineri]
MLKVKKNFVALDQATSTTNDQHANCEESYDILYISFPTDVCSVAEEQHVTCENACVNGNQVLVDDNTISTEHLPTEANENIEKEGNRNPEEGETEID